MDGYKDGFILAALLAMAGVAWWYLKRNPPGPPAAPAGSLASDPYTQAQLQAELDQLRDQAAGYAGQDVLTINITRDATSY